MKKPVHLVCRRRQVLICVSLYLIAYIYIIIIVLDINHYVVSST